jgi:hypothetical protein
MVEVTSNISRSSDEDHLLVLGVFRGLMLYNPRWHQMNKVQRRDHLLPVVLLLSSVLGCNHASCERNTKVAIHDGKNPPTFSLSGNGHLNFFWVSEVNASQPIPKEAQTMNGRDRILWEIWPGESPNTAIYDLPHITYATVPEGFTQKIPAQGEPVPLVDGKIYEAGGPSSGADMDVFRFTVRNGSVVELPLPEDRYRN